MDRAGHVSTLLSKMIDRGGKISKEMQERFSLPNAEKATFMAVYEEAENVLRGKMQQAVESVLSTLPKDSSQDDSCPTHPRGYGFVRSAGASLFM